MDNKKPEKISPKDKEQAMLAVGLIALTLLWAMMTCFIVFLFFHSISTIIANM